MKVIYFMRHSEVLKPINLNNHESLQIQNEKWGLTIEGEKLAQEKSKIAELSDFDIVISSNYVRAILTAKYFAKDKVLIDECFDERKFGVNDWSELPNDFEERQQNDFNYKLKNGESLNEVMRREYDALIKILNTRSNKKILIVGHATALASLFSKWCELDEDGNYKLKGKTFFDGKWNSCETFKLLFDDNNHLVNIENIKAS